MDDNAPWRDPRNRPGPSPYKACSNPFYQLLPGADNPFRIKPDIVHTLHIGFGQDMCASTIVLLAKKGCFGNPRSLDDRLAMAYASYQEYCHNTQRFTACDGWTTKTLGMKTKLGLVRFVLLICSGASPSLRDCTERGMTLAWFAVGFNMPWRTLTLARISREA